MEFRQEPIQETSVEFRLEAVEQDIAEIQNQLDEHAKLLMGDVSKRQEGLFFVVTDLGKLVASQAELVGLMKQNFENQLADHMRGGHYQRQNQNKWERLAFSIADHVLSAVVVGLIVFVVGALYFTIHQCGLSVCK